MKKTLNTKTRNSGIELLKLFAILIIIINHIVQTLSTYSSYIENTDFLVNLTTSTSSPTIFLLRIFRSFGAIGNSIFFICSAWFLLDSKKFELKKLIKMVITVWLVSILILIPCLIFDKGSLNIMLIIKSIFPTTFANNWYITCYLLFYSIHTILNKIIYNMNQKELLRSSMVLLILYTGFNSIKTGLFYGNYLILWITIYFSIAYIKFYLKDFCNNKRANLLILIIGFSLYIILLLLTNYLGNFIGIISNKQLHWTSNYNPMFIIISIALFNLANMSDLKNSLINNISKLSLLIYIFHENIILRTLYRPRLLNFAYVEYGYDNMIILILFLSIAIFIISIIFSYVYMLLFNKTENKLSALINNLILKFTNLIEKLFLKFH